MERVLELLKSGLAPPVQELPRARKSIFSVFWMPEVIRLPVSHPPFCCVQGFSLLKWSGFVAQAVFPVKAGISGVSHLHTLGSLVLCFHLLCSPGQQLL